MSWDLTVIKRKSLKLYSEITETKDNEDNFSVGKRNNN